MLIPISELENILEMFERENPHILPGITYRSRCGNLYTIVSVYNLSSPFRMVTVAMHPDQYHPEIEFFDHPLGCWLEFIGNQDLRQISGVQDLSTDDIIAKWSNYNDSNGKHYLW